MFFLKNITIFLLLSDDTGFFAREFGFTDQETVAIMGAHNMALAR